MAIPILVSKLAVRNKAQLSSSFRAILLVLAPNKKCFGVWEKSDTWAPKKNHMTKKPRRTRLQQSPLRPRQPSWMHQRSGCLRPCLEVWLASALLKPLCLSSLPHFLPFPHPTPALKLSPQSLKVRTKTLGTPSQPSTWRSPPSFRPLSLSLSPSFRDWQVKQAFLWPRRTTQSSQRMPRVSLSVGVTK